MKKFMKACYKCKTPVKKGKHVMKGITLNCMKCNKCGEIFFDSSEMIRYDILTGRRKSVRKFGSLGDSTIVRVPNDILKEFDIKPGDYGVFEKDKQGILIKPYKAKELKA